MAQKPAYSGGHIVSLLLLDAEIIGGPIQHLFDFLGSGLLDTGSLNKSLTTESYHQPTNSNFFDNILDNKRMEK